MVLYLKTPFVHVYVTRSAHLLSHRSAYQGSSPQVTSRPVGPVSPQFAVNQIGRAVCGLRFDNPERIIADLGPTFRDLSIGTLRSCGLFDCLGAV